MNAGFFLVVASRTEVLVNEAVAVDVVEEVNCEGPDGQCTLETYALSSSHQDHYGVECQDIKTSCVSRS